MRESFIYPEFQPSVHVFRLRKKRVNRIPFVETDGGKIKEGFSKETHDCTVRSLALAAGITYTQAHRICASVGRIYRKGLTDYKVRAAAEVAAKQFGLEVEIVPLPKSSENYGKWNQCFGTFSQVLQEYNTGRYVFTSGRHAFAVINGVLHDSWHVGGRTKVGMILRFRMAQAPEVKITQPQINELWARLDALEAR